MADDEKSIETDEVEGAPEGGVDAALEALETVEPETVSVVEEPEVEESDGVEPEDVLAADEVEEPEAEVPSDEDTAEPAGDNEPSDEDTAEPAGDNEPTEDDEPTDVVTDVVNTKDKHVKRSKKKAKAKARADRAEQARQAERARQAEQAEQKARQAELARQQVEVSPAPAADAAPAASGVPVWALILAIVVALVAGGLVGHFLPTTDTSTISLEGVTTLAADDLDAAIATYTYAGSTYEVTAREVIEESSSIASAANDDGTYDVPASSDILAYAQNAIVLRVAEETGLTVTDEEVDSYTEAMFGTSDYSEIASTYSIDEDVAKATLANSALMSKLRDTVCTTTLPDLPDAPTSTDDTSTPTQEYADYVIALLGDEWDAENDTWATTDGTYYSSLSTYEISNTEATYAAAYAAYAVAYTQYYNAYTSLSAEWTAYVNSLLATCTIQIGTMVA